MINPRAKSVVLKDFQRIPGVGKSIAMDFWNLGYRSVDELVGKDPETLYQDLCKLYNAKIDRCMLYVFRCAVYFATEKKHDPERLKWWNWKD